METNQESFQKTVQSTDNLEQGRPVHQRALADNGTQIASNPHWCNPVNRDTNFMKWINVEDNMYPPVLWHYAIRFTVNTLSQQQRTSHTLNVRSQGQEPNGWNT